MDKYIRKIIAVPQADTGWNNKKRRDIMVAIT